jgi:hypothetical protein
MAKKKTHTATKTRTEIIRMPAAKPQTIVVRQAAPAAKHKPKTHRRRGGGGGGGGDFMGTVGEPALAGLVLGYINKNQTNIPTLPGVGRAGTLALACWFFRDKHPILRKLAPGFAAIAAYEWQYEGKVQGLDGLAAQV